MGTVIRIRAKFVIAVAIVMTALLALLSPVTQLVVKLTATALIMDGTGQPLALPYNTPSYISTYIDRSYNKYISPSGLCGVGGCDPLVAVFTPEQLWPLTGLFDMRFDASRALGVQYLDNCVRGRQCIKTLSPYTTEPDSVALSRDTFTVLGYSQSSSIASIEKANLIKEASTFADAINFVMLANPNRPNGGILSRFAGLSILGITFNGAAPTNSDPNNPLTTVDIARQYDGIADFPNNPLNLIAVANAILGVAFLHSKYNTAPEAPQLQGRYNDTTYYMIPTDTVPLLMPVKALPIIGPLLATALDPFVRVLVEAGYDRTLSPGVPAPANLLYFHPLRTLLNLVAAIPVAIDNVLSYLAGNPDYRPLGTTVPGPYGVGGPPVRLPEDVGTDVYGPPTILTSAPAPMMFAAPLSGFGDAEADSPLTASRSMSLFSVEQDPFVVEQTDPTPTVDPTSEPTPTATTEPTPSVTTDPTPSATTDPTPSATTNPSPSATTEPTSSSSSGSTSTGSTSTSTSGSTSSTSTGSTSTSTSTGSTSTGSTSTSTSGSTSSTSTGSTSTGSTSSSTSGSTTSGSSTSGSTTSGSSTSSGSTSSGSTSGSSTSSGSTSGSSGSSSGSSSGGGSSDSGGSSGSSSS